MIYLLLFWSFFQVGLLSIGGGYAALPQIQNQVVELRGWLSLSEFADVVTLSQMTPGPIAINASTFVGMKMGGVFGAVVATAGCVTPSCIIVLLLAFMYAKYKNLQGVRGALDGLRPAVVALIASAGVTMLLVALFGGETLPPVIGAGHIVSIVLLAVYIAVLRVFKVNPLYIIAGSGAIGAAWYFLSGRLGL